MSNEDFFNFFKKYEGENLEKSYPEELYEKIFKPDEYQSDEIELYDGMNRDQIEGIIEIADDDNRRYRFEPDEPYPIELFDFKRDDRILVFNTTTVRAKLGDVKDALWQIEKMEESFRESIKEEFGEVQLIEEDDSPFSFSILSLRDPVKVILTSRAGSDEDEILEKAVKHPLRQKTVELHNGIKINVFYKGDKKNSLLLIHKKDTDRYLVKSFVPTVKNVKLESDINTSEEINKLLRPYQVVADVYKKDKDFAFHNMKVPYLSRVLLKATFKERGIKLEHYSVLRKERFFEVYRINDKIITVLPNLVVKTKEDPSNELKSEYSKLEWTFDDSFQTEEYVRFFYSFSHGLYRHADRKTLSEAGKRRKFPFSVGGETLIARVEGKALRVDSDQIGLYLLKKTHQKHNFRHLSS